jgi:phosphomannomutase
MRFHKSVFKANDIRGVVKLELNSRIAHAVGRALADLLETPGPVAVGYDMRPASVEYATALREGILEQGRDVVDIGLVTSDMIYFAVGSEDLAGGAMVTASHNPGQYDGIKLCRRGAAPIGQDTGLGEIEEALINDHYKTSARVGKIHKRHIIEDWIEHALSFVDTSAWPSYRVAIDAGNGMAGAILPHLEGRTPLKISPLYWKLDGTFPNHPASPIDPANLVDLVKLIERDSLDFGIAFDGDGDRAFLVDAKGEQVSGTVMTAILAEAMLRRYPHATILYNAICGRVVPETIQAHGGKGVRTKVGHAFIKVRMRELDAPFAGEHSGHFYFRDNYHADSGLIAALVAVDVLAKSGLTLTKLADKYRLYSDSGEINFSVGDKAKMLVKLKKAYSDGKQDELDGLTVNYPDWWFNARPSNTEPLLRLNVEAKTDQLLRERLKDLEAQLGGHPVP